MTRLRTLAQRIAEYLRAGALLLIVQDSDEALALAEVEAGVAACEPVTIMSAADERAITAVEEHSAPEARGTLVLLDFLSIYGGNPVAIRLLRQVALQQRSEGQAFTRLVLIERPETAIPVALSGDAEVIAPDLPTVDELDEELGSFLDAQPDKLPDGNGEARYAIAVAGVGLARHEYSRLLARCVIECGTLDPAWLRQQKAERVATKSDGVLSIIDPDAAPVGGLKNLMSYVNVIGKAFASRKAREYGLQEPKGILIVGVPGCAKSLTAKMIARLWRVALAQMNVGAMFSSLVGSSEAKGRLARATCDAMAPIVLLIDEIEKAFAGMMSGTSSDSGTTQRLGGDLLTWFNDRTAPVYIVATANRVESLPPELLRRFDVIFSVDLPTISERAEIAQIHVERRGRTFTSAEIQQIALDTEGFTGAEIERVVVDGMFAAFAEEREVTSDDVLDAVQHTTPLSKTAPDDIKKIRDWAKGRARPASLDEKPTTRRAGVRRPAMKV